MQGLEKLFDLLKTQSWVSFSASISMFAFIYMVESKRIDVSSLPMIMPVAWFCGLVFLAPPAAKILEMTWLALVRIKNTRKDAAKERLIFTSFISAIPNLTERERQVLGYLRHNSQMTFEASFNAEHAYSLLDRKFIVRLPDGEKSHKPTYVFSVNPHIWRHILDRPDDFPYEPKYYDAKNTLQREPWR